VPNNKYDNYDGTSMATPHVSGAALVLWNKFPDKTNVEIRDALNAGAIDLGATGRDDYYGNGLLNYWNSYNILDDGATSPPTASPIPPPPTASPTPCPGGSSFVLTLLTDNYGGETTWNLWKTDPASFVADGGPYNNGESVIFEQCISDGCYTFGIYDSYGDGICCGYGDGNYSITVGGVTVKESDGRFGSEEITQFCSPFCVQSTLPVFDTGMGCYDMSDSSLCDDEEWKTHCPSTCGVCNEYSCVDSVAAVNYNGRRYDACALLQEQNQRTIDTYCRNEDAFSTCRETCGVCE